MDEHMRDHRSPDAEPTLARRSFLSTTARVTAGIAGAGAVLAGGPAAALAERERVRSIAVLRKPPVPITFILPGNPADQITWNHVSNLFHARHPNITLTVQVVSITTWSSYFAKI